MKLKERFAKAFFGDVIREEINKSSRQLVSHVLGLNPSDGIIPDIDFEIFNQLYEQTSWVRAVVGVICKAVTARGYTLVPTRPDADRQNAETLSEFFSNCNPNDTFLEILDDMARDTYVFGNAFVEVVYGADGKPKELWNLDATTMRVKADDHGTILGYIQMPRYTVSGTDNRVDFESKEVIHFKLGTKGATLYGLSPLVSLILPVTVDKFAQIYNRAFFVNGAKIRGAFIMKDATPEQVERNREYLQARAKNPDLAHSDLVLEGSIEFKQIGVNQKDMEFLQLREFTRNEILAVYGVPPSKVSIIETGNIGAGTGEHQTQTFYEETILPFQMRLAEKITKLIIRQGFGISDWAFQFNRRAIDEKDQADIFNVYLQNGVFSPDEVRRIVAPRMPEIAKGFQPYHPGEIEGFEKGGIKGKKSLVNSTQAVIALENRFSRALKNQFQKIKTALTPKIRQLVRSRVKPKVAKRLDDLDVLMELIDQEGLASVIKRFSLEAALKGLKLSAQRNQLKDIDDISSELKELLENNAIDLAANISDSVKSGIEQALIEGLAANETIPELQSRIETQLDSIMTVNVRPAVDDEGNVVRAGHTRAISGTDAAEIIARTESSRAYNEGNLDALSQAEVSNVQFLLADDACEECRAISESAPDEKVGKIMSIDDARGVLPVHPNCRCTWIGE